MGPLRGSAGEDRAQEAVGLGPDGLAARREGVVPDIDVRVRDPVDAFVAEGRQDELVQHHAVLPARHRSQLAALGLAGLEPQISVGAERRHVALPGAPRCDVSSPDLHLDLGPPGRQPGDGIVLRIERLRCPRPSTSRKGRACASG
jgi:hypothetical protein